MVRSWCRSRARRRWCKAADSSAQRHASREDPLRVPDREHPRRDASMEPPTAGLPRIDNRLLVVPSARVVEDAEGRPLLKPRSEFGK
jgi:hypothetical protein